MNSIQGNRTLVTIISKKDNSTLIQYVDDGVLTRKYVPTAKVDKNFVDNDVLEQGIPCGFPWREMALKFDGMKFENEMHNVGLWTAQDVLKSPQKLWSALQATLADNLSTILELAKEDSKGVNRHGK
jgi:hypothetical protein